MALTRAALSPIGISSPSRWCVMAAEIPLTFVATVGKPDAIASISVSGRPSWRRVGIMKASAEL